MRFLLTLLAENKGVVIPVNYQYPLSAAIYKVLEKADKDYSKFLHEKGYGKGFKMFTFSQINCPFRIEEDRLRLLQAEVQVTICFHLPKGAETFIKGLFMSQEIVIADRRSKANFSVRSIEALSDHLNGKSMNEVVQLTLEPLSPVVCGWKNERGNYDFLSPDDGRFCEVQIMNWREKLKTCFDESESERAMLLMSVELQNNPPKSRLISIKAGTDQQTKVRGWMNFRMKVTGEERFVEVLLNGGVGVYNAMGMGCVGAERGREGENR